MDPDPRHLVCDPVELRALYGAAQYGGPDNFEIVYNDNVWQAALVQVGRFGIVYSAVIQVIPQYGLRQELLPDTWENVRSKIANRTSDLFIKNYTSPTGDVIPQHFLQIAINPIPHHNVPAMMAWRELTQAPPIRATRLDGISQQ